MWMNTEDARSDFVLIAATAAIVPLLRDIVVTFPFYPSSSTPSLILALAWLLLTTAAMPWFLTRHRERPGDAWGGPGDNGGLGTAFLVVLPVLLAGLWRSNQLFDGADFVAGNLLRDLANPVVGSATSLTDRVMVIALVATSAFASTIMLSTLVVRARDGFRQTELKLVEGLRTFGMGAAAASLLTGTLLGVSGRVPWSLVLTTTVALVALVLTADRLIYGATTTTRMTLLAPAITSAILHVFAFGGLLTSDPLVGLWQGSLGFGTTVVAATLLETRKNKLAFLVLLSLFAIYPTCMHPLSGLQVFGSC